MEHGFRRGQFGDGGHNAEGIGGEHDEILRVAGAAGLRSVGNKMHRICSARILRLRTIVEIANPREWIENYIFKNRPEALCRCIDGRLGLCTQLDRLGVASALEIEDAFGSPTMLVVTNQRAPWISGHGGFPRTCQTDKHYRLLLRPAASL